MRHIIFRLMNIVLVTVFLTGVVQASTGGSLFELLSAKEASRPAMRSYGFAENKADSGPAIDAQDLEVQESSPFTLRVFLKPRDGAAPDLTTLRVECLKTPVIDLTPRLKPYITAEGVKIDQTTLPPGLHHFRVSVNDVRGRLSEKDFTIMVSGAF